MASPAWEIPCGEIQALGNDSWSQLLSLTGLTNYLPSTFHLESSIIICILIIKGKIYVED